MGSYRTAWLGLLLTAAVGCAERDGLALVVVTDSAGIEITESVSASWEDGSQWRLGSRPDLVIGSSDGDGPTVFGTISDVEILPGGIAVLDGQAREIRLFGSDGSFHLSIGREGDGPGEFRRPAIVRLTQEGELFVWDRQLARASWFNPSSGELLRTRSLGALQLGGAASPREVLPLSTGSLAARDGNDLSQVQGQSASRDTSHFAIVSPAAPDGILVAGVPGVWTISFTYQGNSGFRGQPFTPWPSWDVVADTLFIASGEFFEILKATRSGVVALYRRRAVPDILNDTHLSAFRAMTLDPIPPDQRSLVEPILDVFEYPERVPAYSKLLVDPQRYVWVERPGPAGLSPGPGWDVYAPDGIYLGEVTTPEGAQLLRIGVDHVLSVWRDELDVPYLHRYALSRND